MMWLRRNARGLLGFGVQSLLRGRSNFRSPEQSYSFPQPPWQNSRHHSSSSCSTRPSSLRILHILTFLGSLLLRHLPRSLGRIRLTSLLCNLIPLLPLRSNDFKVTVDDLEDSLCMSSNADQFVFVRGILCTFNHREDSFSVVANKRMENIRRVRW
jgi:hypothetical protein